jgi:hypothetical protein
MSNDCLDKLRTRAADSLDAFADVLKLATSTFDTEEIELVLLPKPHKPPSSLPRGKMAVYSFFHDEKCLKVGKVGAKSQARYVSQHYLPNSSMSNLAKSLINSVTWSGQHSLEEASVGPWIKTYTDRINFILPESAGLEVLSLLEAFLHCRWKPEFEGKSA